MVLKNFFDILSFMIRQIFIKVKKAFIVFFLLFTCTMVFASENLLRFYFLDMPVEKRVLVHQKLSNLGFFTSNVDGRYSNGTERALRNFNSKYLNNNDLSKFQNVKNLYTTLFNTLPECEPRPANWDNCFGTYDWDSGERYVGEWKENNYHRGTFTFSNGEKYKGEFKNGKYEGQGTFFYISGNKYVGEWKDNKFNGQGTFYYLSDDKNNGDTYVGEWKNNVFFGQGTYTWVSGDKYVGEYNNGIRHGQGTYSHSEGHKYVGEWRFDKRHGQGTYTYANGDKYVGEYNNDIRHGQGTYSHSEGHKYVGEWRFDKRHGQGTYTWGDGRKDVGEFKNDKLNGYAIQYISDGSIKREGIFKDGIFQYAQKKQSNNSNSNFKLNKYKEFCEEIGLKIGTEKFADCVLKAMEKD